LKARTVWDRQGRVWPTWKELKILRGQPRAGSSPALGTKFNPDSAAISSAKDFDQETVRLLVGMVMPC
jgi:hypothetical protein